MPATATWTVGTLGGPLCASVTADSSHGAFNRAELYPLLRRINTHLLRWIMRKYKKHGAWKKAIKVLAEAAAYAGSTGRLNIVGVFAVAACAVIAGDNAGYWPGRFGGPRVIACFGRLLRIDDARSVRQLRGEAAVQVSGAALSFVQGVDMYFADASSLVLSNRG